MTSCAYLTLRDGTRRIYLEHLGKITGQTWSTNPNGGETWACNFLQAPDYETSRVYAGMPLTVLAGTVPVWAGTLKEPQRGDPWALSADGLPALAKGFTASPSASYATDTIIDGAISRGLRWTRTAASPTISGVTPPAGSQDLDTYLAAAAQLTSTVWNVDAFGVFTMAAPPTAPSYLIWPGQDPGAYTVDEFANVLLASYLDSTTGNLTQITATNAASVATLGPVEKPADLTQLGYMPAATATAIVNDLLTKTSARFRLTDTFELTAGRITTMTGTPVDGRFVTAGQMAQLAGVRPMYGGESIVTDPIRFVIGETTWDDDNEVLTVRPQDAAANDFASLLTPQMFPAGLAPT